MGKILKKEDLNRFLYKIKTQQELIAPVNQNGLKFEKIQFISQINIERNPLFSPKKYFFSGNEELFKFKDSKVTNNSNIKSRVIFGIRLCDINAINVLDKIHLNKDSFYKSKREKTTLVGINCRVACDNNCFCASINQKMKGDLLFHDIGDSFYIEVNSDKGLKLVSRLKDYSYEIESVKNSKKLEKKDISKFYNDKVWEENAKNCISCGNCTLVCPTCSCYSNIDVVGLNKNEGSKIRETVSCQYDGFWKNENDEIILKSKMKKLRHRIFHKIKYFKDTHGISMCTGCGRCISNCPSKIDFTNIINRL